MTIGLVLTIGIAGGLLTVARQLPDNPTTSPRVSDQLAALAATATAEPTKSPFLTVDPDATALLNDKINALRRSKGLRPLTLNVNISKVAEAHSQDMANRGYYAHDTPEGLEPQDRMNRAGLRMYRCGENLMQITGTGSKGAAYIAEESYQGWLNSPGHYQNMIDPDYSIGGIGVAVVKHDGGLITLGSYDIYVTHNLCFIG